MSKIQINNLPSAGSELFQGSESFLTELQATEAHTVFGGKSQGKKNKADKYAPNVVVQPPVIQQPIIQQPIFVPVPVYVYPVPVYAVPPQYPGYPCGCA
jgi:hypothetical protein